jgi:plasmid stabilization system protein ParE
LSQVENTRAYLVARNPEAAARVVGAIRKAFEQLRKRPFMGRPGDEPGTREWSGVPYSYVIVYRVLETERLLEIAGVFHTAQGERKL